MDRGHEVVMLSRFVHTSHHHPLTTIQPATLHHHHRKDTADTSQERPALTSKGFTVLCVDYSRPASLHVALTSVDTVISTVSSSPQLALIDSCLSAHVRRFAPAEFEGVPYERPVIEQSRDKINTLHRLHEVSHRLQSTVFCCGVFYEWFAPGGLLASGVSTGSAVPVPGFGAEGAFLLDMRRGKARIPALTEAGEDVYACFTAAGDAARFVARCLEIRDWPGQLRMCGERLKLVDIVAVAESVLGRSLDVTYTTGEELQDALLDAEEAQAPEEAIRFEALIAIQRGEFDFCVPNVNEIFPDVEPVGLKSWLQGVWKCDA